jgi:hypothetical protein
MSTKPKPPAPGAAPLLKNAGTSPLVYFDKVPVFGTYAGNLEIELAARMLMPKPDGGVVADMCCTGHLRCSPQAAIELIDALQKALDMLTAQQSERSELLDS